MVRRGKIIDVTEAIEINQAREIIQAKERESGAEVKEYPLGREGRFCRSLEMRLKIAYYDKIGKRIAEKIAQKYRIELGYYEDYAEDMPEPLEKYPYYRVIVRKIDKLETAFDVLVNAKRELQRRIDKLYDHLANIALAD